LKLPSISIDAGAIDRIAEQYKANPSVLTAVLSLAAMGGIAAFIIQVSWGRWARRAVRARRWRALPGNAQMPDRAGVRARVAPGCAGRQQQLTAASLAASSAI
jgi:hypothetical protein